MGQGDGWRRAGGALYCVKGGVLRVRAADRAPTAALGAFAAYDSANCPTLSCACMVGGRFLLVLAARAGAGDALAPVCAAVDMAADPPAGRQLEVSRAEPAHRWPLCVSPLSEGALVVASSGPPRLRLATLGWRDGWPASLETRPCRGGGLRATQGTASSLVALANRAALLTLVRPRALWLLTATEPRAVQEGRPALTCAIQAVQLPWEAEIPRARVVVSEPYPGLVVVGGRERVRGACVRVLHTAAGRWAGSWQRGRSARRLLRPQGTHGRCEALFDAVCDDSEASRAILRCIPPSGLLAAMWSLRAAEVRHWWHAAAEDASARL